MEKPKETDLKAKTKNKKIRSRIIVILIIAAIVGLVVLSVINGKNSEKLVFETETLERGLLVATVSTTGTLSPVSVVDVGSQVSGTIEVIYVDFNQRVKKGQILVQLDRSIYQSKLEVAQAQYKSAQSDLVNAGAQLDKANIAINQAQANIYQAQARVDGDRAALESSKSQYVSAVANAKKSKAQLDNDSAEYKRALELFKRELISASEKEKAYTTFLVSRAAYESAQASIKVAESQIVSSKSTINASLANLRAQQAVLESAKAGARAAEAQISGNMASIQQAQGRVDEAQVNIEYCTIRSPIDGVVIDRKVEPGQTVAASFQTPVLLQLAENLHKMELKASVDEADIGKVKKDQEVKFTVDAFPDENFVGRIFQVRSAPKSNTSDNVVTYDVIIYTDNNDLKLKPGMTANIDITVNKKDNVLLVPNAATRFRPGRFKDFPYPDDVKKEMEEAAKKGKKNGASTKAGSPDTMSKAMSKTQGRPGGRGRRGMMAGGPGIPGGSKTADGGESSGSMAKVWVLVDGKPIRYSIKTGITDNKNSEMVKGDLKEGMEIIVDAMTQKEKKEKEKKQKKPNGTAR